jgi:demethylspheroidene O-methyltransferase
MRDAGEAGGDGPGAAAPLSLVDRLLALRDRIYLSPTFHRVVFRVPGLRSIGRRRASDLFDICAGFVYSQALYATVRLGVLEAMCEGPKSAAELTQALGLPEESTIRLLKAATALRLVGPRSGGRYGLGDLGAAFLANPGLREMVLHHAGFYRDLGDPVAVLSRAAGGSELAGYWGYGAADQPERLSPEQVAAYSELMSASLPSIADIIFQSYSLKRHRVMLDVGGGDGTLLRAASARAPHLELMLFDLPGVVARAEAAFATHPARERVCIAAGSFARDPLPEGADLVTLVRVLLDHDDATIAGLLRAAAKAIAPGGRILVGEPMNAGQGTQRVADVYFGLYLHAMGRGRVRRPSEIKALLTAAGFANPRLLAARQPLLARIIVADAPDV